MFFYVILLIAVYFIGGLVYIMFEKT